VYGAILGDIFGSIYEFNNRKTDKPEKINLLNPRCFFTDDTVLTVAVADKLLHKKLTYEKVFCEYTNRFPKRGYGHSFNLWARSENRQPYNSWGNGSAMRVSPIGWAFKTLDKTLTEAKRSAEVTHNHIEGIKGAQATATAIFLARTGKSKAEIKEYITNTFDYCLARTVDEIRPKYKFNESCMETVPEAITAFLESRDFTHAIQLGISLGGDTDTLCAITGGIAEAFYKKIPQEYIDFANDKLPSSLKNILLEFSEKFD